ncbi:MAG: fumarylacetoacetate hydrolase family protein [Synergistaceae bacterium]|nr:fumarylacetoacetate hydrolase family protein [Synergistaceae bacterium]
MTCDVWGNIGKLREGTRLARVLETGGLRWGCAAGENVELLDEDLNPTGEKRETAGVNFAAPIDPVKIWCIGLNYREHAKESKMEVPDEPCVFMKPRTCLVAHGEPVKIPSWAGRVDYEGELAVVIGKTCKNVDESKALGYVLGYSCFNDVSARVLQKKDGQWIRSKGFDTFGPFGPILLLTKELPSTSNLTTRLNGAIVQKSHFGDMIFSVASIISHLSRFATLEPGDVIATGTPSGVGPVKPGDRVEISIDGVGTLNNPFAAE